MAKFDFGRGHPFAGPHAPKLVSVVGVAYERRCKRQGHQAVADLAKELLEIEAKGDRERAENWFKKYDVMPPDLVSALKAASKVPVDVDPIFDFKEEIR